MNLHSQIKMKGDVTIKKFDQNNKLNQVIEVKNLIVTAGKQYIAQRMTSGSTVVMSHMAIGNNSTTAVLVDTTLNHELGRVVLADAVVAGSAITYTAVFGPGVGTGNIVEAGIFNDDTAGTMLCRTTFPVIAKLITETIAISWTVTVG